MVSTRVGASDDSGPAPVPALHSHSDWGLTGPR